MRGVARRRGASRDGGVSAGRFEGRGVARRRRAARPPVFGRRPMSNKNVLQCDASLLSAARRHAGMPRPSPQLCWPAGRSRARRSAKMARPQGRPICSARRAPNRPPLSRPVSRGLRSTYLARGPPRMSASRPFGFGRRTPRQAEMGGCLCPYITYFSRVGKTSATQAPYVRAERRSSAFASQQLLLPAPRTAPSYEAHARPSH